MNKFSSTLLVGLVAALCLVALVTCDPAGLTNELSEEEDFGQDGGLLSRFGSRDVLEEGVEDFAPTKENACRKSKGAEACSTCCEATGMAGKYVFEPSVKRVFKQHLCYCFQRATL